MKQVYTNDFGENERHNPFQDAVRFNALELSEAYFDEEVSFVVLHTFFTTNDDGNYDTSLVETAKAVSAVDDLPIQIRPRTASLIS